MRLYYNILYCNIIYYIIVLHNILVVSAFQAPLPMVWKSLGNNNRVSYEQIAGK